MYELVDRKDSFGNYLLIYAKHNIMQNITNIQHDSVKFGMVGNFTEYGCCAIHLKYADTTMCFVNCFLPSGRKKQDRRMDCIKQIHRTCF